MSVLRNKNDKIYQLRLVSYRETVFFFLAHKNECNNIDLTRRLSKIIVKYYKYMSIKIVD
jgi:hypothetical protein